VDVHGAREDEAATCVDDRCPGAVDVPHVHDDAAVQEDVGRERTRRADHRAPDDRGATRSH
jgi:hypothetical protein